MNEHNLLKNISGKTGAYIKNAKGFSFPVFDRLDQVKPETYSLLTAKFEDISKIPFSVFYEQILQAIAEEGLFVITVDLPANKIDSNAFIIAQRMCQSNRFEFITLSFQYSPTLLILRKTKVPKFFSNPNNNRPLRYELVDRLYVIFMNFPRIKKFLKKIITAIGKKK